MGTKKRRTILAWGDRAIYVRRVVMSECDADGQAQEIAERLHGEDSLQWVVLPGWVNVTGGTQMVRADQASETEGVR